MTRRSIAALGWLAPGWLLATPAGALEPIDDFEQGEFAFSSASAYVEELVEIPWFLPHAISPVRRVVLSPAGGSVSAETGTGIFLFDQLVVVEVGGDGWCALEYELGTMDLTTTGTHGHIELDLELAPDGGEITLIIDDANGSEGIARITSGDSELLRWDLAEWSAVDVTEATRIGIRFGPAASAYRLTDARFRRTQATPIEIIEWIADTSIPPLPSPPLRHQVWDAVLAEPIYEADLSLTHADAGFVPELSIHWSGVQREWGDFAVMNLHWEDAAPFSNTSFEIRIDVASANGYLPELYPPDPIAPDAEGILLTFPIRLDGGEAGTCETHVVFDPAPGQLIGFENVTVTPGTGAARRAWGTSFTVGFDLTNQGQVDDAFPIFRITWLADRGLTPSVAVPGGNAGLEQPVALDARPTVTAGGTMLHASRPFAPGARVVVHDVAGRAVRALEPEAGVRTLRWDGRDAGGHELAPGVYFVRLDAPGATPVRVVRVP